MEPQFEASAWPDHANELKSIIFGQAALEALGEAPLVTRLGFDIARVHEITAKHPMNTSHKPYSDEEVHKMWQEFFPRAKREDSDKSMADDSALVDDTPVPVVELKLQLLRQVRLYIEKSLKVLQQMRATKADVEHSEAQLDEMKLKIGGRSLDEEVVEDTDNVGVDEIKDIREHSDDILVPAIQEKLIHDKKEDKAEMDEAGKDTQETVIDADGGPENASEHTQEGVQSVISNMDGHPPERDAEYLVSQEAPAEEEHPPSETNSNSSQEKPGTDATPNNYTKAETKMVSEDAKPELSSEEAEAKSSHKDDSSGNLQEAGDSLSETKPNEKEEGEVSFAEERLARRKSRARYSRRSTPEPESGETGDPGRKRKREEADADAETEQVLRDLGLAATKKKQEIPEIVASENPSAQESIILGLLDNRQLTYFRSSAQSKSGGIILAPVDLPGLLRDTQTGEIGSVSELHVQLLRMLANAVVIGQFTPAGASKILTILDNAMKKGPKTKPKPMPKRRGRKAASK